MDNTDGREMVWKWQLDEAENRETHLKGLLRHAATETARLQDIVDWFRGHVYEAGCCDMHDQPEMERRAFEGVESCKSCKRPNLPGYHQGDCVTIKHA